MPLTWKPWLFLLVLAVDGPVCLATLIFVWANGPGWSFLALVALCLLLAVPALLLPAASADRRRPLFALAFALLLFDAGYAAHRLNRSSSLHPRLQLCTNGDCAAPAPLLARLIDEEETARAGLYLSRLLFLIGGEEFAELERSLMHEYGELAASPDLAGTPNVIFVGSSQGFLRYQQWLPPDRSRAPCLIFLHGFGGGLSAYMKVLIESKLGHEAVILAPILNYEGAWWRGAGPGLVSELIKHYLPPQADPGRLFLVGLSNGAIGATSFTLSTGTGPHIRGAILLSGIGAPAGPFHPQADLLAIAGTRDERFPVGYVRKQVAALSGLRVRIELKPLEGTHLIMFSQKAQVTDLMWDWLEPRLSAGQ